ncbi:MAG: glutathione S-transferase family protein [Cyanobacteria bacterium P01_F01_bin.143]
MYKLYSIPGTCSTGIVALLKKLEQPVEIIHRDDVPDYAIRINPANQVPILDDDGMLIREGAAIVLYLLEKYGSPWLTGDHTEKADFQQWLMFNYATLHPAYGRIFTVAKIMEEGDAKAQLLQQLADKVSDTWKLLNKRLETRNFVVGNEATIIDYLIVIYSNWNQAFPKLKITLGENVERLVEEVSALPEIQAAYESENIQSKIAA